MDRNKFRLNTIFLIILLLTGLAVIAYPTVSNYINERNSSYVLQELRAELESAEDLEIQKHWKEAQLYNQKILDTAAGCMIDVTGASIDENAYYSTLCFSDNIMGSLEIPAIDVLLPIYHGVSTEVLAKGVGHLPQSAFPIGGEGNHAVLTGHTGLPSAKLFTDLVKLREGDCFLIHILDQTLAYVIDKIQTVLPEDVQYLTPVTGEDYCTLVTCTPYGVNSHRLLVRGRRSDVNFSEPGMQINDPDTISQWWFLPVMVIAAALLPVIAVTLFKGKEQDYKGWGRSGAKN